jgi:hypothetical protein
MAWRLIKNMENFTFTFIIIPKEIFEKNPKHPEEKYMQLNVRFIW